MSAEVITAILTPISVMVLAYFTFRTNVQVKKNHAKTEEVLVVATQVDHAVNGRAAGEPSISKQVDQSAQDITTILDKQERDLPTPSTEDVDNGNGASIRKQLTHLTQLVETLIDPAPESPSSPAAKKSPGKREEP